jgi:colanic acid/amylovoran biosynthesis glycosyltransferase
MKILYVLRHLPRISETFISDEIRRHLAGGHEVHVLTTFPHGYYILDPKHAEKRPFPYSSNPAYPREKMMIILETYYQWRLPYLIKKHPWNPDIIHAHFGTIGLTAAKIRQHHFPDSKLVVTFHGHDASSYIQKHGIAVYLPLFQNADVLLTSSQFFYNRLLQGGAPAEKLRRYTIPIDVPDTIHRHTDYIAGSPVRLLSIGRLTAKKGYDVLINAIAQLITKRPDIPVSLDIIGDGEEEKPLRQLIRTHRLENRVSLLGGRPHDDVLAALPQYDIFILASRTPPTGDCEGIPLVLKEAMAMELPVISTMHAGIPELVEHNISGVLVEESNATSLASALEHMLDTPDQWQTMGQAGRIKVLNEFNAIRQHQRLHAIYLTALNDRNAPIENPQSYASVDGSRQAPA